METYYVIVKNKLNGSKQYFAISDFDEMYWTDDSEDAMWFATYDDEPLIRELYETNDPQQIDVSYSASSRRRVSELLIMSAQLTQALPRPNVGL
mgnify:CR=1 FL=1